MYKFQNVYLYSIDVLAKWLFRLDLQLTMFSSRNDEEVLLNQCVPILTLSLKNQVTW